MPLYLDSKKQPLLFLHIPKTGGTTIEAWLESVYKSAPQFLCKTPAKDTELTPQHFGYETLNALLGKNIELPLLKFAIVRNPYDKLESEFFYRAQMRAINLGLKPEKMFSAWVCDVLQRAKACPALYDNHLRAQVYYYYEDVCVYKFEEGLENIVNDLAIKLDVPAPKALDSKKVGKKKPVVWSNKALALVNQLYHEDFIQFEYQTRIEQRPALSESARFAYYRLCYSILTQARQVKHKLQKAFN